MVLKIYTLYLCLHTGRQSSPPQLIFSEVMHPKSGRFAEGPRQDGVTKHAADANPTDSTGNESKALGR